MDETSLPCVFGVDVGGTNTDAVVLLNNKVFAWSKQTTTPDVTTGVLNALIAVLNECRTKTSKLKIQQINIGTTHFVNAVVQRSAELARVAVIRLARPPCTQAIPPFSDFPDSLKKIVNGGFAFIDGGYEFDGCEMAQINEQELIQTVQKFVDSTVTHFAICGLFSSTKQDQEKSVAAILRNHFPNVSFTCSHEVGQLGLLERENASILNESLKSLCKKTFVGLQIGLSKIGLNCPMYFTQNDGTICSIERALKYPVFTFASGPTNSMRGAAFVSGLKDAIVVDIGGTSTDIGILINGFPRQAGVRVQVGEVPTNFRMPSTISLALGGGTKIRFEENSDKIIIGPESVGYMLTTEAICFGGSVLTTTDAAVADGLLADIPANDRLKDLRTKNQSFLILKCVREMIEEGIDQMKTDATPIPVVLVGGGSVLLNKNIILAGSSQTVTAEHHSVANAIGAALCQISGEIDAIVPMDPDGHDRPGLVQAIKERTIEAAVNNGADQNDIQVVDFDEIPLTYLPGNAVRMKCTAVGPLKVDLLKCQELDFITLPKLDLLHQNTLLSESKIGNNDNKKISNLLSSFVPHEDLQEGPWTLNMTDIVYICEGAAILGCGGGGSPHTGKLRLMNLLAKGKCPTVVSHEWLMKNGKGGIPVFSVGFMGAPVIQIEKLPAGCESLNAIRLSHAINKDKSLLDAYYMKNDFNCDFVDHVPVSPPNNEPEIMKEYAVMTPEIGGLNSTEALAVSAEFDVYCVDCDEMGRAFPELQMSTKLIYGRQPYPSVQANEKGRLTVTVRGLSHKAVENLNRQICIENGCSSAFVLGSIPVDEVKECCVIGSISRAWTLGKNIFEAKKLKKSPIEAVLNVEAGKLICNGKLVDVQRKIEKGFNRGHFTLDGLGEFTGKSYTVDFQNENLIVQSNNEVNLNPICNYEVGTLQPLCIATVPDLICLVDTESGEAIPTEDLRYGLRASLLVLEPSHLLTTEKALEVVGPKAFGYKDLDYKPLFK